MVDLLANYIKAESNNTKRDEARARARLRTRKRDGLPTVRGANYERELAEIRSALPRQHQVQTASRVNASILSARLSEIPDDTRDLTARLCGDPLPGRSALDRRAR